LYYRALSPGTNFHRPLEVFLQLPGGKGNAKYWADRAILRSTCKEEQRVHVRLNADNVCIMFWSFFFTFFGSLYVQRRQDKIHSSES